MTNAPESGFLHGPGRLTATAPASIVLLALGVASIAAAGVDAAAAYQNDAAGQLAELVAELEAREVGNTELVLEAAERAADDARAVLDRLDAIDPAGLSHDEELTLEVLRWNARAQIDQLQLYWYFSPVLPATSPLRTPLTTAPARTFVDEEDLDGYLETLQDTVETLDAAHRKVRGRAARMIVLPDEQLDRVIPFVAQFAAPATDSMLAVADDRLEAVEASAARAFQQRVDETIEGTLAPAAARLVETLESLRSRAPNAVGWAQYPGGKEAFRIATRLQTTLDVTPEQVHQAGLDAVADIERQMAEVRSQIGFAGTKEEFHEQLRRDPRFYVETPEEFGGALMAHIRRLEPEMDRYFPRWPEAPYDVTRLHPALEPSMTYGFYARPSEAEERGLYNFNGSKLGDRSLLVGAALIYHELLPGHHFAINLQLENEDLPDFRRTGYFAGFGEGWGEYSSSVVAREAGMYEDPYDLYGRLVFDSFFAVRLVVDTGMNYYGWSRPKAMLYMRTHTLESDVQIDSETIRYSIRSPAQALAYRMGRQTFVRLRAKAEAELGADFDLRRYHDAILMIGMVPLTVLEGHVDWWIEQERAANDG